MKIEKKQFGLEYLMAEDDVTHVFGERMSNKEMFIDIIGSRFHTRLTFVANRGTLEVQVTEYGDPAKAAADISTRIKPVKPNKKKTRKGFSK